MRYRAGQTPSASGIDVSGHGTTQHPLQSTNTRNVRCVVHDLNTTVNCNVTWTNSSRFAPNATANTGGSPLRFTDAQQLNVTAHALCWQWSTTVILRTNTSTPVPGIGQPIDN